MKGFNFNGVCSKAVVLLVIMVFAAIGCSENPLGADKKSEPQMLMRSAEAVSGISLSTAAFSVQQRISAETGGILNLLDVTLEIPPGAVPKDTIFSIDIPDINVFYNEFGTSGLVFDVPVKVTMSYRNADLGGVDESTIRIGWLNPNTNEFIDVECEVDFSTQTVTGYLDHFSAYALISDEQ